MSQDINTTGVCHKCGKWFDMNHRCKCETGVTAASYNLAPVLREGVTVCSWCRFVPAECICGGTAGNLVGPRGDDCEDAQGPHVKAEGAQRLSREAVALHMGEAHRSKLPVADSLGSDGATFYDCGLCGRDISSCSCDYGV